MKRIAALGLSLALILTLALPAPAAEQPRTTFPDIQGHWAQRTIEKWASYGMVHGDAEADTFRPDDYLTRAEFAVLLDRVIGYRDGEEQTFPDVDPQEWYAQSIFHLGQAGVLEGYLNGTIRPNQQVTRQEAAVMICRAFHIEPDPVHVHFLDRTWVSDWAEDYVGALHNMGVIQGYDGRFEPLHPITRAQAVTILDNLVGGVVSQSGVWGRNAESSLLVNKPEVTLQHITVGGNLWVSEGVGDGSVTLEDARVKGEVILYACGEKGFRIGAGGVVGGTIHLYKLEASPVQIRNESGKTLPGVSVEKAEDTVYIEGDFDTVTVGCGASVRLGKGTVGTLVLTSPKAQVTVEKECTVTKARLTAGAEEALLKIEGAVKELETSAAARVDNQGRLTRVTVKADGLVLDGKRPTTLTVEKGVDRPKDSKGTAVYGSGGGSHSSGSSGGSSSTPSPSPSPSPDPDPDPSPSPDPDPDPSPSPDPDPSPSPDPDPPEGGGETGGETPDPSEPGGETTE